MDKIIVIVLHLKEANTAISPKFLKNSNGGLHMCTDLRNCRL